MTNVGFLSVIKDQTQRSLWSLHNVIDCIPDDMWGKPYCGVPIWKHVYHTLHSLDRWYINPNEYEEPEFHLDSLNDLNTPAKGFLFRNTLEEYVKTVEERISAYLDILTEEALQKKPEQCAFTRFGLILAQHRHLDMHIGMLMGFVIAETEVGPRFWGS